MFCIWSVPEKEIISTDNETGGYVYGFITTGESWGFDHVLYNGQFQMTDKMNLLLNRMRDRKEKWMKDHSVLVEYIWFPRYRGREGICRVVCFFYYGVIKKFH